MAGGIKNAKTGEYGALSNPIESNWDLTGIGGKAGVWIFGGESGIRTHDELAPIPVFETGAFVRSAISPRWSTKNYSITTVRTCIEDWSYAHPFSIV